MSGDRLVGLIPLVIGLCIVVLARPVTNQMNRWAEWQLRVMQQSWFPWYYRVFGSIFAIAGLAMLFQSHPE